jgi:integrase
VALPGAHRTVRDKTAAGGGYYIRWTAWRGKGAPVIGAFKGATRAAAESAERAGAGALAGSYSAARTHVIAGDAIAGLLDLYEQSAEFKKCSDSTKAERSRLIKQMRFDAFPGPPGSPPEAKMMLGKLPTAGLAAPRMVGHLTRWRDTICAGRGPRAADARVQVLQRALNVMCAQGLAPANPAAKLAKVWSADRSDLIWDEETLPRFYAHIRKAIDAAFALPPVIVHAGKPQLNRTRFGRIMQLAAARDALTLVISSGMRREDLACLNQRECTDVAFVYTARKGARRARTAGRKPRTTIVPMLWDARKVVLRRLEAHGSASPWIIVSSRGGAYTPNTLGELVNNIAREIGADRTLHDGKGTFVTRIKRRAPWLSDAEIADMVDWSEADVATIIRRYVSHGEIAKAKIERLRDWRKASG